MDPFFSVRDCLSRAFERKKTLIFTAVFFLVLTVCGMCFVHSYAFYDYHLNLCNRFLDRICFSDRSVFLIWLERSAGLALLLLLVVLSGVHPLGLVLAFAVVGYRACTFGGSIVVFFSAYGMAAAPVVFVLYLPVHLLADAILILGISLSCGRARSFCFCRRDFGILLYDFATLLFLVLLLCAAEAVLLLALFHPIGNIL